MDDFSICDFIKNIQADPLKKIEGLTVGKFEEIAAHVNKCQECASIIDEVTEKYKDTPSDPNSEWSKSKYN